MAAAKEEAVAFARETVPEGGNTGGSTVGSAGVAQDVTCPSPRNPPKKLFYPCAKFPSANLAPINPPYYYMLQTGEIDERHAGNLSVYNVGSSARYFEGRYERWLDRGVLPLLGRTAKQDRLRKRYGGASFYEHYKEVLDNNFPGFTVDEYLHNSPGMEYRDHYRESISAVRRIRNEDPQLWIHGYVTNVDNDIPPWVVSNHDMFDVIVLEAKIDRDYSHHWNRFREYISNARQHGMQEKTIISMLGGIERDGVYHEQSRQSLRNQIAEVRRRLPESPGIAIWAGRGGDKDEMMSMWDILFKEFFIDPAPSARITSPSNGQIVSGTVTIQASGTPNSGTGKAIREYRFFVDNVLVAVGGPNTYQWNTDAVPPGRHTLTVHAVDADYLAGVDQVEVVVQ